MAKVMDSAIEDIRKIWHNARVKGNVDRPRWPMIIMRSPKGWTGPKVVDGVRIEDNHKAHQVPISMKKTEHLKLLEDWLLSYKPAELFTADYKLNPDIADILPKGNRRISANPHANGGLLLKEIVTPNIDELAVDIEGRGQIKAQDMYELGGYIKRLFELNKQNQNFRTYRFVCMYVYKYCCCC